MKVLCVLPLKMGTQYEGTMCTSYVHLVLPVEMSTQYV